FFIVDEVHMLTIQAFNALFKILEEPPEYLIFILATTNPEKIPQTIISRCQRFALHRLKVSEVSAKLLDIANIEKVTIDGESLFLIAKLGDGALRDSLGIFDMAISFCGNNINFKELKEFLNLPDKDIYFSVSMYINEGDSKSILKYFNELEEQGFDIMTFYNGLITHYRDLLVIKSTGNAGLVDESDVVKGKYIKDAEKYSEEQIRRILNLLFESEPRLKYSSNQKILMESLLVELCRVNRDIVDLSNLITGLEALKKKSLM
ncbi:MAG: DNA polymerase III subunit gamma/tau, partial [Ignavibacteriae bacterium]|nr:DNA polymerase III subunit gamma/tau [Ignavibacteriota bacterium]